MQAGKALGVAAVMAAALALGGCGAIREHRGYIQDPVLVAAIQPGIDNERSVAATLGRPSFTSQFGEEAWYYVSSVTGRRPFVRPTIKEHSVLAVQFDEAGNVVSTEQSGLEEVVYLRPDGEETPTLGRERGFFEDLFGNIGQVGAAGVGGAAGPGA